MLVRRRTSFLCMTMALFSWTLVVLPNCGSNYTISNSAQAAFSGFSTTPGNVSCRIWFLGKGNVATVSGSKQVPVNCCYSSSTAACNTGSTLVGCDYGTTSVTAGTSSGCVPNDTTKMIHQADCISNDSYYINTDPYGGGFDGCPQNTADRVVIVAEDSTGKYAIISRTSNGANWSNLDDVATQAAAPIPSPLATITGHPDASHTTVDLTWTAVSANGGYAPGDAPPSPVVTGYKIYAWDYSASSTPPIDTASWQTNGTLVATVSGASSASYTGLVLSNTNTTGNAIWLAMSLTFDSGFEGLYVSPTPTMASIGPTPAGVFASVSATQDKGRVTANWRTNTETGVAFFEVWSATSAEGPFAAVPDTRTAPKGSNSSYSVTFRLPPAAAKSYTTYVKIKDQDTNGQVHWSDVVKAVPPPPSGVLVPTAETPVKEPMKRVK